jgi:hypothetical protein
MYDIVYINKMFQETVSLILKHSDISLTSVSAISNNIGSWSNGRQSTTWKVNLRKLLGNEIYNDNDIFVLRLNQLAYGTADFPNTAIDQQLIIRVSGLNFINSSYNVASGNAGSYNQLVLVNMATSANVINYSPNIAMCNFGKSGENVEFTIELIRTIDNLPAVWGVNFFPNCVYSFDIYPVKKNLM